MESEAIYQPDATVGELKLWRAPDAIIAEAKVAADALRRVIDGSDNKPTKFGDKEHLKHEHWEILGHFFGYCTKVTSTEPLEFSDGEGNKVFGFLAAAELLNERTGVVVGRAEAMCLDNEEMWGEVAEYEWQETFTGDGKKAGRQKVQVGTKPKPWFQLRSMAQTRASAKAFRHKLAWVAVLAGYSPTPESEMTGSELPRKHEPETAALPTEIRRKPLTPSYEAPTNGKSNGKAAAAPVQQKAQTRTVRIITEGQARRFYAIWKQSGKTKAQVTEYLLNTFNIDDDRKMPADSYEAACQWAQRSAAS